MFCWNTSTISYSYLLLIFALYFTWCNDDIKLSWSRFCSFPYSIQMCSNCKIMWDFLDHHDDYAVAQVSVALHLLIPLDCTFEFILFFQIWTAPYLGMMTSCSNSQMILRCSFYFLPLGVACVQRIRFIRNSPLKYPIVYLTWRWPVGAETCSEKEENKSELTYWNFVAIDYIIRNQ
jgi:hypothetical protein